MQPWACNTGASDWEARKGDVILAVAGLPVITWPAKQLLKDTELSFEDEVRQLSELVPSVGLAEEEMTIPMEEKEGKSIPKMSTGRNKHDIRTFCPPTMALISTCELERCTATHVVAGLDPRKRSSTNNPSLGSCPASKALPAAPGQPGYAGYGLQCFFSTTALTRDYCFVDSFACLFSTSGLDEHQIQLVVTFFSNSGTPTFPSIRAEASREGLCPASKNAPR